MSYIGKNPEADSVKLKGSATEPSGTAAEGQVYFNTGTGSISKGMKVYKNSQFVAIDKQLGDADTMQLLKAADIPAIDFNLSYTSTTVGGNGAVPKESSTGDFDGTAAFTNSSTGDALLTDDSDDLVFHYTTQATNSADNDFWGIPLTVPRAFRGGNLVLEFKYRTEIATGTMDNGYFNIAIQDRSAMILQTQATSGAKAAGADVTLTGKTYSNPVTGTTLTVAVGDRVFVESGTGTAGDQANDIVDCYITSVSSTTNVVTLSKDIVAVSTGAFVTGWLTGYDTGGQIDAFASDTNKDGTSKKLAFKTEADTQQISVWFFVKGTSTVKHELFFDNVLLSGNKFLQIDSQLPYERYFARGGGLVGTATAYDKTISWSTGTVVTNTLKHTATVEESASNGWSMTMLQDCKINMNATVYDSSDTFNYLGITVNSKDPGDTVYGLGTVDDGGVVSINEDMRPGSAGDMHTSAFWSGHVKKGDVIRVQTYQNPTGGGAARIWVDVQPITSPVVVLESQDEIFTDWVDWTPSFATANWAGGGANDVKFAKWRRVGSDMEAKITFAVSSTGSASTNTAAIPLPDGYSVDISQAHQSGTDDGQIVGRYFRIRDTNNFYNAGTATSAAGIVYVTETGALGLSYSNSNDTNINTGITIADLDSTSGHSFYIEYKVPIQGWNANFNPLLSMPLVDLGQPVETWMVEFASTNNFWAGSGAQYTWNKALLKPFPNGAAGTIADSNLVTVSDFTSGTNTVTGITAKQDIVLSVTVNSWLNSSAYLVIYNSGQEWITASQQFNSSNYAGEASAIVNLKAGDYIYFKNDGYNDDGGVTFTAQKVQSGNMAHIIKPAVAVITEESSTYGAWGGDLGAVNTWHTRALNTVRGESWFVTLNDSTDTFTLEAGTYKVIGQSPLYAGNAHKARLYNSSDSVAVVNGQNSYSNATYNGQAGGIFMGTFNITSSKDFKVQHIFNNDNGGISQGGFDSGGTNSGPSMFTTIMIEKLK